MVDAIGREYWQDPTKPVNGPHRRDTFRQGVVHWEGADRNWTPHDIPRHLRNIQAAYLRDRGYSLGYGFAVVSDDSHPQNGTRWEIRGTEFNMASNPGARWKDQGVIARDDNANDFTGSVLIIGPANRNVSRAAAEAVRNIFSQWHAQAGTVPVRPLPHSVTDYTTCCGPLYSADLAAGLFDPVVTSPPVVSPPPIMIGEDNVLVNLIRYQAEGFANPQPAVFAQYSGGYKIWVPNQDVRKLLSALSGIDEIANVGDTIFLAAGPVLPGTPLPYQCDAWGRREWS